MKNVERHQFPLCVHLYTSFKKHDTTWNVTTDKGDADSNSQVSLYVYWKIIAEANILSPLPWNPLLFWKIHTTNKQRHCFIWTKQDGKLYSHMLLASTLCTASHPRQHCRSRVGYTVFYIHRRAEPEGEADITEHHTAAWKNEWNKKHADSRQSIRLLSRVKP
jgi:hypothetical protein